MSPEHIETLEDIKRGLKEAARRWEIIEVLLRTRDLKTIPGKWVEEVDLCLVDMFANFRLGEDALTGHGKKTKPNTNAKGSKSGSKSKPAKPKKSRTKDLPADPNTIPGQIRQLLQGKPDGVLARDIIRTVIEARPDTKQVLVSGALGSMVKRGEIARQGFHKNFRYILIKDLRRDDVPRSAANGATTSEESDVTAS